MNLTQTLSAPECPQALQVPSNPIKTSNTQKELAGRGKTPRSASSF
ncbi:MAG: hypothetical protein LBC41_08315 [Clostridiales bacterium]|nr:hypothetical protein [Clostridiales bacterium]